VSVPPHASPVTDDDSPTDGTADPRVPAHREAVLPRFDGAVFDPEDYLHFYEDALAETTVEEVDALETLLDLAPGDAVADVPCGYGRHANRLAERGHEVCGLDAQRGFLELARQDAAERGIDPEYLAGDVRELPWLDDAVDAAYSAFTSFGYFDEAGNRETLAELARVVRPGGRVLVDTVDRDALVSEFEPVHVERRGADLLVDDHEFDPRTGRLRTDRLQIRDGERSTMTYAVRAYTYTELAGLFDAVGLDVVDDRDGLSTAPYDRDATRLCLVGEVR
jgi:ubiquinone/menaquinone biosynthesis C-methylase UbiE